MGRRWWSWGVWRGFLLGGRSEDCDRIGPGTKSRWFEEERFEAF